jgi:predicted kinase
MSGEDQEIFYNPGGLSMIVMLNGLFGVGKTTVAKLLYKALPGGAIYDPEWVGYIFKRLPKGMPLKGAETDDYQDIDLWRRSVVAGVRLFHGFISGPVIVPMTFSDRPYFDEVVKGLRRLDPALRVFCLQASLATVKKRLVARGTPIEGPEGGWIARRIIACTEAHRDAHFGEPVDTGGRSACEIAEDIVKRLQWPRQQPPNQQG